MIWLKQKLFSLFVGSLDLIMRALSQSTLIQLIACLTAKRGDRLSHKDRMRFLYDLDGTLLQLRSQAAVSYEGGVHPKHRLMRYHEFFTERINKGEQVLDIGCSIGAVAYDIAEKAGAFVLALDIEADDILWAKKTHPHPRIKYCVGDAMKDLPSTAFDVVVISNVLEHLDQRSEFLRYVLYKANPTRLLIRVPLYDRDWEVPMRQEVGAEWRLDSTHAIEYTLDTFKDEMQNAGLKIREFEIRWGEIWAEVIPDAG